MSNAIPLTLEHGIRIKIIQHSDGDQPFYGAVSLPRSHPDYGIFEHSFYPTVVSDWPVRSVVVTGSRDGASPWPSFPPIDGSWHITYQLASTSERAALAELELIAHHWAMRVTWLSKLSSKLPDWLLAFSSTGWNISALMLSVSPFLDLFRGVSTWVLVVDGMLVSALYTLTVLGWIRKYRGR